MLELIRRSSPGNNCSNTNEVISGHICSIGAFVSNTGTLGAIDSQSELRAISLGKRIRRRGGKDL